MTPSMPNDPIGVIQNRPHQDVFLRSSLFYGLNLGKLLKYNLR